MWALDKLLSYYERRQADAAAEFYMAISGIPSLGFLRGRVMERQALRSFDSFLGPTTLLCASKRVYLIRQQSTPIIEVPRPISCCKVLP